MTTAKIIKQSYWMDDGRARYLTTIEANFPRVILAELNTHRAFSRNSASSRAIPVKKMIAKAVEQPYVPSRMSLNQKGMNASEYIYVGDPGWDECLAWWLDSRDKAVEKAYDGIKLGLHKQVINRVLEPYLMHTAIISSTEWDNFFQQRLELDEEGNPLADIAMYELAVAIQESFMGYHDIQHLSHPDKKKQYHIPYVSKDEEKEIPLNLLLRISAARNARVSYLNHDGNKSIEDDLKLFEKLIPDNNAPHYSPLEHVAHPDKVGSGNFKYWKQLRFYYEEDNI